MTQISERRTDGKPAQFTIVTLSYSLPFPLLVRDFRPQRCPRQGEPGEARGHRGSAGVRGRRILAPRIFIFCRPQYPSLWFVL